MQILKITFESILLSWNIFNDWLKKLLYDYLFSNLIYKKMVEKFRFSEDITLKMEIMWILIGRSDASNHQP